MHSVIELSRLSGIDCNKSFLELRLGTRFFSVIFEERFGAIDSREPEECYNRVHIIRNKFYDPFVNIIQPSKQYVKSDPKDFILD